MDFLTSALAKRKAVVDAQSSVVTFGKPSAASNVKNTVPAWNALDFGEKGVLCGLANQGATCYLNSLLQCLFMTPEFRSAIYSWDYDKSVHGDEIRCIPFQLAKLFARLEFSERPFIRTNDLTQSFGWKAQDVFMQHDVQELSAILFEALRLVCSDFISPLFQGWLVDFIHCQNCHTRRERQDPFYDISLTIKPTLIQSLESFVEPEILEGSNAYRCGECNSKQTANKGVFFKTRFPDYLRFHLKRFAWSYDGTRSKVQTEMTIPQDLDMNPFLISPDNSSNHYALFAILLHNGSPMGGHYFCYVKKYKKWYRFNDTKVTELTDEQVNVWSSDLTVQILDPSNSCPPKLHDSTFDLPKKNAYMLVYRRVTQIVPAIIEPPQYLKDDVAADNKLFNEQKIRFLEQRGGLTLCVHFHNAIFAVETKQTHSLSHVLKEVYDSLELSKNGIELNQCRLRKFDILRNVAVDPLPFSDTPIGTLLFYESVDLLLEVRPIHGEFPEFHPDTLLLNLEVLAEDCTILPVITISLPANGTVADLRNEVRKHIDNSPFIALVFIDLDIAVPLDDDSLGLKSYLRLTTGSLIRAEPLESASSTSRIPALLEISNNNIDIHFNTIGKLSSDNCVSVRLSDTLSVLRSRIAEKLSLPIDGFKIRRTFGGAELKNLDANLAYFGIENGTVYIEYGTPLKDNEYFLKVLLDRNSLSDEENAHAKSSDDEDERFHNIGSIIVSDSFSMNDLKKCISEIGNSLLPPIESMRIRERVDQRLTKVYHDSESLKSNAITLRDFKELVVQKTRVSEQTTPNHLLISFRQWFPERVILSKGDELSFHKTLSVIDLKKILSDLFSIPSEFLKISKCFPYQIRDLSSIPLLDWEGQRLLPHSTLGSAPWRCKDGDCILVKDSRQKEQIVRVDAGDSNIESIRIPVEHSLKIYTAEEQLAREAEISKNLSIE